MTTSYGYDSIYQLLSAAQGGTTTESYSYDPVGNRQSSLGVASYTVNSSNELTADSNASFTYDANGNTLTKVVGSNTTSYAWDFENRLSSVTLPGSGGTVTFKYDPFGRRIEKISPTTTSTFAYDGNSLIETLNSTGSTVARYSQGQNIDEPLAMQRGTTIDYYEQDGVGSVTSLTATNGSVVQSYTYDSFGNLTNSSGSLTNFLRYTAREFDTETNLYYRARYYDPATEKFLTEDPIEFGGGINFYRYAENSATNLGDPFGLQSGAQDEPPLMPPPASGSPGGILGNPGPPPRPTPPSPPSGWDNKGHTGGTLGSPPLPPVPTGAPAATQMTNSLAIARSSGRTTTLFAESFPLQERVPDATKVRSEAWRLSGRSA